MKQDYKYLIPTPVFEGEFREPDHPRDPEGKFTDKGGSAKSINAKSISWSNIDTWISQQKDRLKEYHKWESSLGNRVGIGDAVRRIWDEMKQINHMIDDRKSLKQVKTFASKLEKKINGLMREKEDFSK